MNTQHKRTKLYGLAIAVVYTVVFISLVKRSGVDYDEITDTTDNLINGIVYPLTIVAIALIVTTSILRWWGPVLREDNRLTGWLRFTPVLFVIAGIVLLDFRTLRDLNGDYLFWVALAALMVGFCEELAFRGLVIVGFRRGMPEAGVWLWSSVAFALLHLPNIILGADTAPVILQVILTFMAGSTFYVCRRATGTIVVPILLHAFWDFGAFTVSSEYAPASLALLCEVAIFVVTAIALKRHFTAELAPAGVK